MPGGRLDGSAADAFLTAAGQQGLAVSGLLFYLPPWIEAGEGKLPVRDLPGWAAYVAAVPGEA